MRPSPAFEAQPLSVGFLLYDGFQPIDLAGPWQVLASANEELERPHYQLHTIGKRTSVISADGGLAMQVGVALDADFPLDMLFVPGGPGIHHAALDPDIIGWLRRADRSTQRTCCVGSGAYALAAAGLLDGHRVTIHWKQIERLRQSYPAIEVLDEQIYVHSGKYWTSAGVTAGMDLALELIERDCGPAVSSQIARRLLVYLRRDGGQPQQSRALILQDRAAAPFRHLLARLACSLDQDWPIGRMAEMCGMSRRSFQRKFTASVGMPPAAALGALRSEQAGMLARGGGISRKAIAREMKSR